MLFNSYIFVLAFLPITLIGYYCLNKKKLFQASKAWLLFMSLYFYGYFNIKYLPIILVSIGFNYIINNLLHKNYNHIVRKVILFVGIITNLSVLFYFKYYDFFISNINSVFNTQFNFNNLILPLGISFFTFQQVSYVVDSYNREVPNYNILDYSLFVTFFPQLIAGPIVLHDEIIPQLEDKNRKHINYENFAKGIMAFGLGLAKKVLIADTFGNAVNWGYTNIGILDTTNSILVMLAYTIQVYFDFSGYSDMAVGIGLMFNIELPINFNSPYKAFTISEFWKRWHMTLTRFFTKYIYIPLGGNRKGTIRTYINVFTVFFISGIWHGANWTFILWGILHGIALVINRLFKNKIEKIHPVLNWIATFAFVNITWIYFRAPSISNGTHIIKNIIKLNFGSINEGIASCFRLPEIDFMLKLFNLEWLTFKLPYLCMSIFFAFALFAILGLKNTNERIKEFKPSLTNGIISIILTIWCILSFSGVSTFLYFNF